MGDQQFFWALNAVACLTSALLHVLRSRLTVGPSIALAGLSVFLVWGLTETGWWVTHGPFRFNGALMTLVPSILCGMAQVYALDGVRIARTYFVVCLLSALMAVVFLEFRLALAAVTPIPVLIQSSLQSQFALVAALALALGATAFAAEAGKRVGDPFALVFGTAGGVAAFAVAHSFLAFGVDYGAINLKNEVREYAICALPALFVQIIYGQYAARQHIVMPVRRFADLAVAWNSAEREAETAKRDALEARGRIVELQELTRALRDERRRRLHQTANSPLAIIDIGPDRRVAQANDAAIALLGRATGRGQKVVGEDADALFPGFRSVDHSRIGKAVFEVSGADGARRVELALLPLGTSGRFGGFSAILEDVTLSEQARERERTAMRIRDLHRTARAITHDFSNLFTAIEAHASLLSRAVPSGPGGLSASTAAIGAAVMRGRAMLAQLGAGQSFARPELAAVDVAELVRETFAIHRAAASFAGVVLRAQVGAGCLIQADPHQIARVLVNLVGNSLRATGRCGEIVVSAAAEGPGVGIVVRDTGCGMSETQVRSAFDPAFSTKGDGAGGLGLAVSYLIIDAHGGRIDIESTPGEGTAVRLWLPAVDPSAAAQDAPPVAVLMPDGDTKEAVFRGLAEAGVDVLELDTADELEPVVTDLGLGGCVVVVAEGADIRILAGLRANGSIRIVRVGVDGTVDADPPADDGADCSFARVFDAVAGSLGEAPWSRTKPAEASA